MASLRPMLESLDGTNVVERRREAYMRANIRRAVADGYVHIAVVCGAWHVPALGAALDAAMTRPRRTAEMGAAARDAWHKLGVTWPSTIARLLS